MTKPDLHHQAERPFAITLEVDSSLSNRTGTWRTERPLYTDRMPPCNNACPAGENIQKWLYAAEAGDIEDPGTDAKGGAGYEAAWRQIMQDNPMPAVMGRVCYHPCETSCNRGQLDTAVGINSVERFLGDIAIERGWQIDSPENLTGKKVLVIGAGPSGLSAAYHLRRMGHEVTIHEAGPVPGGMMRFGIPAYRLPRTVLEAEVARIEAMGVDIRLNTKVDDLQATMDSGDYDAVFLAIGAHIGKRAYIPAGETAHIMDAVQLLRSMEGEEKPYLGRKVVIYGGGNTAMDAARTAKRLGASDAIVVYRRTRDRMPAHDIEVEEAMDEGIMMRWLSTIKHADEGKLVVEKMELDDTGFPQPTGETEELEADTLVLALGQDVDTSLLDNVSDIEVVDGVVQVGPNLMTGRAGVFAGGDMVPSERTVTVGIGHGKKAARHIDAYLRGTQYVQPPKPELATFDKLNTWYYTDAPQQVRPVLDAVRRTDTFDEVVTGLDADSALFEARRCMSCGNCFGCDNCYGVCPDNAVIKHSETATYEFNLDYCKGCSLCAHECPCGAIRMEPEPS